MKDEDIPKSTRLFFSIVQAARFLGMTDDMTPDERAEKIKEAMDLCRKSRKEMRGGDKS